MSITDLTGKKFTRLTVIERAKDTTKSIWVCKCDCGKTHEVNAKNLTGGGTKSCGCLKKDMQTGAI